MSEDGRQLTHVVLDLVDGRVRVAANFAAVCGLGIGPSAGDTATFFRTLEGRIPASARGHVDLAWEAFRNGATQGDGDLSIVGDDGIERRVECFWYVERSADGKPTRVVLSGVDTGAARRTQGALHELEARHGSALKAGRMGSWETDLVHMTRHWSVEGMTLFGLDLVAAQGHVGGADDEYLNALHPDDRHLAARYYAAADEQDSFAAEYRIVRPDGATRWLAGRGLVLARDVHGKAQRLVSIMADVTERRLAEEDLRMERERLILALGAGRMGAFDLDIERDVLWWSPQMYEVFGVSPDTFVPTRESVAKLVHPDDFGEFVRRRSHALAHQHPFEAEARINRPDGKIAWVAHRGHSTYDLSGKPQRSFGVTMDITERKTREQALRDADRMKDDFIATLAHELRNPLAPIRNAIALLRRNAPTDDPQAVRHRDVIFRQVAQMSRLLDDLLDVSRIARGQVDLQPEPVQLRALFEQAIEVAQPSLDAASHSLEVVLPTEPVEFVCDGLRLAQVLSNLLINAAKYTPAGGHVLLSGSVEGAEVVARVQDDGIGIDSDQIPRIFAMFGQADGAHHRSQGGLGIGLALARGLVELHGGRIEVTSEGLGKGSTFAVHLPLVASPRALCVPQAAVGSRVSQEANRAPLRILVADDLPDISETLAEILESMGHEVRIAHDGIQALQTATMFVPDVAFLDLGMPGMDGYSVAREIRSHDWGKAMTLICQTGWGQTEDRRKSRAAGFDHHLVKPVDIEEVLSLLARR